MQLSEFTSSITVHASRDAVFSAIQNFRAWWSEEIVGVTDQLNGIFFHHYKDIHLCKLKQIESIPGQRLVYEVIDNTFSFVADKTEWIGTHLVFELSETDGLTTIHFTHEGLVPSYECYEICEDAWTTYIQVSLRALIETGKGQPNPRDADGINASIVEKWLS